MYAFAQWDFVDKHRQQKFDSIGEAHDAALMAMGVITAAKPKEYRGPQCPLLFAGLYEKYRELKFIQRETADTITLIPRGVLTWGDLDTYQRVSRQRITAFEAPIIMGLDAIFEGREHD